MDFATVNISEREIFEQVLKREYAEFFIKKFGSFRTYALQEFRKGRPADKAAKSGMDRAIRRIRFRKCLDGLSAAVYLLTFRKKCFEAVVKAHKDASQMGRMPDIHEITEYLQIGLQVNASVKGIYRKWIISEALLKGKRIFSGITEHDFVNI